MPRLATFAVDQGFWYSVPDHLMSGTGVGSIVRVPLSGRRVRGYVVEVAGDHERPLKAVSGLSSDHPIFDERLLRVLEWAATHYVAPLSVLLDRCAPPNLPKASSPGAPLGVVEGNEKGPLGLLAHNAATHQRGPLIAVSGRLGSADWLPALGVVLATHQTVVVVVSTSVEAESVFSSARELYGERVLGGFGDVDRDITAAWVAARTPGRLVIGTPRVAFWALPRLALGLVLEEGRRAMKDRQTPTVHVRDLLTRRSRLEGFSLGFLGPTPSLEVMAGGAEVIRLPGRAWSLVEVVDRSGDPPGSGYVSERVVAALRAVTDDGGRVFLFTHRSSREASMRCTSCRRVRSCQTCGSRLSQGEACRRCGAAYGVCAHCGGGMFESMGTVPDRLAAAVNRLLGRPIAGFDPGEFQIAVGTERDLAGIGDFDLVVVADADGLLLGQDFRASEEALRVLARLGNMVGKGSGRRLMVQTSLPESDLIATLRSGDPIPYLERQLALRASQGMPPARDMMAVELRGLQDPAEITEMLMSLQGAIVLGPARSDRGFRWLLQGDLSRTRLQLRTAVQTWRDRGLSVRIDADPIDL